jgi:hypothetical protein
MQAPLKHSPVTRAIFCSLGRSYDDERHILKTIPEFTVKFGAEMEAKLLQSEEEEARDG